MSEPDTPTTRMGFLPPVVAAMLVDSVGVKRMQESIAASMAASAVPFGADFQASMTKSIAGIFPAAKMAGFLPSVSSVAGMFPSTQSLARLLPAVDPDPPVLLSASVRSPMVAMANRVESALDRHASFVVSTLGASIAPVAVSASNIDRNVSCIAQPRFHRLRLALQIVGGFTVIVGAVDGVVQIARAVASMIH